MPKTIFQKIWDSHVVVEQPGSPAIIYIDLHLVHEVTSPQAFTGLRQRGLKVHRPEKTLATLDHSIPTSALHVPLADAMAAAQIKQMEVNAAEYGIPLHGMNSPQRGIIHVIAPELGRVQPGMTIVCGDSHTATHGAFGALAFGIGTSEIEHVLAMQCLLQKMPQTYQVNVVGSLPKGVTAKDIILAWIARIGTSGGTGYVFEFTGPVIRGLSMEQRMTICNMSIEAGARAGIIAPDDVTFEYLSGRQFAPHGSDWDRALAHWKSLPTDDGATYDKSITLDVSTLEPMITYGTNPGMGMKITGTIPTSESFTDSAQRAGFEKALAYMGLTQGQTLMGQKVDVVFIGSCTNSRLSDLRLAASVLKDRKVAKGVRVMVVPGSQQIKRQAESEGLDRVFKVAGAEWRESGCSMCIAMNGDELKPGQYAISTSNRNFEGRQGKGGRTFLASPLTAAAAAVNGVISDVRTML